MHVLLVGAELEENLAVRYLAAALERAGHTVERAPFGNPNEQQGVLDRARERKPGLIGLSMTFQRRAHEFGALATALRADGYAGHLTCGGHFPTFSYRALLDRYPALDSAVRHEGEATLPALCEALELGTPLQAVAGLAFREGGQVKATAARPLCEELDALPFPKRVGEPEVHLGIPTAFLVGSRGCYGHCTFCCINAYIAEAGGSRYRARSPGNLADEIAALRQSRGARMMVFHDDDFFTRDRVRDLARVTALRDALRARGVDDVAFVVKARPDDVDREVFSVLKELGLLLVYLGIEAGSTQGLKTLGRGVDLATNRRGLATLRELDVYACYNMLLFDPDSTLESLRSSVGFLRENADVPMNFCRTEIYVGTPLAKRLAREGRLVGDEFGWDYRIAEPAAERAFRVFARTFLDRNFRCDGLMNANLGLGYHLHLVRHFYPHAFSSSLREMAQAIIRRVNLDCATRMERLFDFAQEPRSEDRATFDAFCAQTLAEVTEANDELEAQVAEATRVLVQAARSPRPRPRHPRSWRKLAAATLSLAPLAYGQSGPPGGPSYPPPDPPPPPHTDRLKPKADAGTSAKRSAPAVDPSMIDDPPSRPFVNDPLPRPMPPDPVPPPHYPPPDPPPPPHEHQTRKPDAGKADAGIHFGLSSPGATQRPRPPRRPTPPNDPLPPPPDPLPPPNDMVPSPADPPPPPHSPPPPGVHPKKPGKKT